MNAITHPQRIGTQSELQQVARHLRRALPAVVAVLIFAAVFAVALVVRFVHLARTNPEVAATLHRIAQALGLASLGSPPCNRACTSRRAASATARSR